MISSEIPEDSGVGAQTSSKKRRNRRKRLQSARSTENLYIGTEIEEPNPNALDVETHVPAELTGILRSQLIDIYTAGEDTFNFERKAQTAKMSSTPDNKSREEVLAAREAKKSAKLKAKSKGSENVNVAPVSKTTAENKKETVADISSKPTDIAKSNATKVTPKGKDEVDRASSKLETIKLEGAEKSKEDIKSERAAKKAAKQAKKKGESGDQPNPDMTVKDVVETLKDIANVAKEVQNVTAKVEAISLDSKKQTEEGGKSKAELRAERRAKQEAQRAAKQGVEQQKQTASKTVPKPKAEEVVKPKEVKEVKAKASEKPKAKSQNVHRVNWFQHLHMHHDKESLKDVGINSNLHPAIIKLGVQSASRVVTGSNARCIALLDALKKMVKDYTLPAKTEFARGLESHLAASLEYLWRMRQPAASQTNAVKFFRHHLNQLPNNINEFDAKKILQEEIDRYIREQIDMAGEAISLAVRNKISPGDNILTYGCSSLIERILCEAWEAGVKFRAVVAGCRLQGRGQDMLRRLAKRNVPCTYIDITALSFVMKTINKVVVGASALLVNGSVLGAVGTAQVALVARSFNVPVLVACETHKFSERVQTDAFVYNEIGDPDELIDKSDSNSPLKDWRSNPNLTPLNLTYDVTPASLVTAVVTELAILPCTSAPVVLRFKLSEYGV